MAESNFVDYVKIYCRSGRGGAGSTHLRREKFVAKADPTVETEEEADTLFCVPIETTGHCFT